MRLPQRPVALFVALILCLAASAVRGDVYVWEDSQGRTHYANDKEYVPREILEDENAYRLIETVKRPSAASRTPGTHSGPRPQRVKAASAPAAPDRSNMGALQDQYRNVLQQMRDYRKRNQNLNTPEYRNLQKSLRSIRKEMSRLRKRPKAK